MTVELETRSPTGSPLKEIDRLENWLAASKAAIAPAPIVDTLSIHPLSRARETLAATDPLESKSTTKSLFGRAGDFASWLWGFIFPKENIDASPEKPQESQEVEQSLPLSRTSASDISMGEWNKFVGEMRQMTDRIRDFNEANADELNFDKLLVEVFKKQIEDRNEEHKIHLDQMFATLDKKRQLNKDRLTKMDDIVNTNRTSEIWGYFEKATSALGVVSAAATGPTGAALVILLVGVGLTADSIFDDWGKKKLSQAFSSDEDTQNKLTEYMKLGAGVISMAVFMKVGGKESLNAAVNLSKAGTQLGKSYTDVKSQKHSANFKDMNFKLDKNEDDLKRDNGKIKALVDSVHNYYTSLHQIARNKQDLFTQLARR
jgi:hypothetical protein